jgi:hypothetical protein
MKTLLPLLFLGTVALAPVLQAKDDVPRGYVALEKLAEAQAEAKKDKKLVTVVAKGFDDQCPHCVSAFAEGTKGLRSDTVMVFARVTELRAKRDSLPASLKEASARAADGAAVNFYVFDSDMTKLVAQIGRSELQKDPRSIRDTRKAVKEARQNLGASGGSALDSLDRQ